MRECRCKAQHPRRRVVLTGGPGAGKTAVLEMVRQSFCQHVCVLPEAAGILFGGGFPRETSLESRRATQRAIYHVERELEELADAHNAAVVLCDRGTVDGAAYWPGPGDLWQSVGTTLQLELQRYDAVIQLRTPTLDNGYHTVRPLRVESVTEAMAIDQHIAELWSTHPRHFLVEASKDFLDKARLVLQRIEAELPPCCEQPRRQS